MDCVRFGKYETRATLGGGGMGTVYEAWDPALERRVAIKAVRLPHDDRAEAAEVIARFRREAQAAGRLSHPSVVRVFDYGEANDAAYIVMEFVTGRSLKSALDAKERLPLPALLRVMEDLLEGLQYSHDMGVIHRDIKPGNIMLTPEGRAKIADFGIARIEDSGLTQIGMVLGTPAYMSPEQFMGRAVDARTDIYSAGIVLYQMLTGERPFQGGSTTVMHKALNTRPRKPSEVSSTVPPYLDAVVERAMARRPEDRYSSAAEFARALRDAARRGADPLDDEAARTTVRPHRASRSAATPAPSPVGRPRRRALGMAAALIMLIAGAGAWLALDRRGEPDLDAIRREVRNAVAPIPCALVSGDVAPGGTSLVLDGLVSANEEAGLRAAVSRAVPTATVTWRTVAFDGPHCTAVELLRPLYAGFGEPPSGLAIATADGRTHLAEGDPIVLRISAPGFRSRVKLDYLQSDGTTYHMQPSASYPAGLYEPGSRHAWGDLRPGMAEVPTVQAPFGTDMIIAIASEKSLLPDNRQEAEDTSAYLRELEAAIRAARDRGETLAATAFVLVTSGRP